MDLDDALARRRSCRSYQTTPVPAEDLMAVLGAALRAPSAGNSWGFEVVALTAPTSVDDYWNVTLTADRRERFPWPGLLRAPVLLLATIDPEAYPNRYAEPDKAATGLGVSTDAWPVPYWWVDAGGSIMAMLLAATGLGLGSLLFGVFDHEAEVRSRFAVPDGRRIVGVIALGTPDGADSASLSARRGRPGLGEFVHFETW